MAKYMNLLKTYALHVRNLMPREVTHLAKFAYLMGSIIALLRVLCDKLSFPLGIGYALKVS